MGEASPETRAFAEFACKVSEISSDFADQVQSQITLGELLEIFSLTVLGDIGIPVKFKAKLKGAKRYEERSRSRVGELNDSVFVEASEALGALLTWGDESGQSATPAELASRLTLALKMSDIEFSDIRTEQIMQISAASRKRVAKAKIGDVVGIPRKSGGYLMALVVARNRFGTALGLFRGAFAVPKPQVKRSAVVGNPIYTDDQLIATGGWPIIDHNEDLLDLFLRDPEIYHAPDAWPNLDFGEFGAAETADGKIRPIGAGEADAVGLAGGSYRQVHMSEHLQRLLDNGFNGVD